MIGICIGFGLVLFAAAFAVCENIRMMRRLKHLNETYRAERDRLEKRYKELSDAFSVLRCKQFECDLAAMSKEAEVKEVEDKALPYFLVYRKGHKYGEFPVKYVYYDRKDPDDREYKRVHAEEVAEILNEKP